MNDCSLLCKATQENDIITILSPSIGRIELLVGVHDFIQAGQCIGHLFRLAKRFRLVMGNDQSGFITSIAHHDGIMSSGYGQPIMTIDPHVHSQKTNQKPSDLIKPESGIYITSPMDGLFYLSSAPENPPFINIGDHIIPGQTIGLIEVMKSFYPVKYQGDKPAIVTDIVITTATPVVTGTKLFLIK